MANTRPASGHPRAGGAWHRHRRAHGPPVARAGPLTPTTPYPAAVPPSPPARHGADRQEARHRLGGGQVVPPRGGTTARRLATPPIRPAGAPSSAKGTAPLPTIVPPSSASWRATRERRAYGAATMRSGRPATTVWLTTGPLAGRGLIPLHGRVIGGAIRARLLLPTVGTHGRGMIMVMVRARSMATPARGRARRAVPTCVSAGVSTNSPGSSLWRRMQPWSMRHASHPS